MLVVRIIVPRIKPAITSVNQWTWRYILVKEMTRDIGIAIVIAVVLFLLSISK